MTVEAPLMTPVEAGVETHEIVRAKPGRKPLPEGEKIEYHDERVSMRTDYWKALQRGAEALTVLSLSGKNRGKPSWRAMIRFLCENMDWIILAVRMIRRMSEIDRAGLLQQYRDEERIRTELRELEEGKGPRNAEQLLFQQNQIMGLRIDLEETIRRVEVQVRHVNDQAIRLTLADAVAP